MLENNFTRNRTEGDGSEKLWWNEGKFLWKKTVKRPQNENQERNDLTLPGQRKEKRESLAG